MSDSQAGGSGLFPTRDEILTRNAWSWEDESPLFISSVPKALRVLYAFGGDQARLTLAEIARISGLDASAAQRFVHTLKSLGLIHREPNSRRYRLAPRLLDFAYLYLRSDPLCAIANAHLHQLSRQTGEAVNLSILDRADVVYISRFPAAEERDTQRLIGGRMPSFLTSNGRVLLAGLERDLARAIVEEADRRPLTRYSLTDPDAIMARVDVAREKGYAVVDQESELGVVSIAVPVRPRGRAPVAAINLPLPARRWTLDKAVEQLLPDLLSIATTIGRSLQATDI